MFWEELYIRSGKQPRMDQHLYKYLVLHDHLCIPELGSFTIKHEPANLGEDGLLYAPKPVIQFSKGLVQMSEKLFFDFLSAGFYIQCNYLLHPF